MCQLANTHLGLPNILIPKILRPIQHFQLIHLTGIQLGLRVTSYHLIKPRTYNIQSIGIKYQTNYNHKADDGRIFHELITGFAARYYFI